MKYVTIIHDRQYEIEILKDGTVMVNGEPRHADFLSLGSSLYSLISDHNSFQVVVDGESGHYEVLMNGHLYEVQVLDERALLMAQRRGTTTTGTGQVSSPMPGLIVAVPVKVGDTVSAGQTVAILESMKMQNEMKTPIAGVVQAVHCEPGQTVDKGALLAVIQAGDPPAS
jgi:biotin carboxyl carrier protein